VPIFALLIEYRGDPPSDELLDAHRSWLFGKFKQGHFILSGGLEAVPGRPASALAIFQADGLAVAEALVDDEPLFRAGALSHRVVPFTPRVRATDVDTFFDIDTKAIQRTS
jgi:uncharacterized protein YciI